VNLSYVVIVLDLSTVCSCLPWRLFIRPCVWTKFIYVTHLLTATDMANRVCLPLPSQLQIVVPSNKWRWTMVTLLQVLYSADMHRINLCRMGMLWEVLVMRTGKVSNNDETHLSRAAKGWNCSHISLCLNSKSVNECYYCVIISMTAGSLSQWTIQLQLSLIFYHNVAT